jgi:hypothetical protein
VKLIFIILGYLDLKSLSNNRIRFIVHSNCCVNYMRLTTDSRMPDSGVNNSSLKPSSHRVHPYNILYSDERKRKWRAAFTFTVTSVVIMFIPPFCQSSTISRLLRFDKPIDESLLLCIMAPKIPFSMRKAEVKVELFVASTPYNEKSER